MEASTQFWIRPDWLAVLDHWKIPPWRGLSPRRHNTSCLRPEETQSQRSQPRDSQSPRPTGGPSWRTQPTWADHGHGSFPRTKASAFSKKWHPVVRYTSKCGLGLRSWSMWRTTLIVSVALRTPMTLVTVKGRLHSLSKTWVSSPSKGPLRGWKVQTKLHRLWRCHNWKPFPRWTSTKCVRSSSESETLSGKFKS